MDLVSSAKCLDPTPQENIIRIFMLLKFSTQIDGLSPTDFKMLKCFINFEGFQENAFSLGYIIYRLPGQGLWTVWYGDACAPP